jgi:hypothetical protein
MTRARSCLLPLLVLLVAIAGARASAQTDISGDWQITVNSPMGPRTTPLSLKQEGEKVTGSFKSQAGELPVSGTLVGDDLKLAFTLNVQGNPIDITLTGKVTGASIAGMADFGGLGEGEFTAKPAPPATTEAPTASNTTTPSAPATTEPSASSATPANAAGTWIVTFITPGGEFPGTATLAQDGGSLSGTFGSQMGEAPVSGTLDGHALKLTMTAKTPQGDLNVSLTGDVDGDSIVNGKAEVTGMGQMAWSAKRKQ